MDRGESVNWTAVNTVVDDIAISAGVVVLIVRQFRWRSAELHRMLQLPVSIVVIGLGYLAVELSRGFSWAAGDWIVVAELVLVAATGTAMGYVTRFRRRPARSISAPDQDAPLQYKLTSPGLWLWVGFVVIRVASYYLAARRGADVGRATGLVLISFGINRVAAVLVVRRRARRLPSPMGSIGLDTP